MRGPPNSTVAVIPARGGSKSIPRKNLAPLGGLPLITWSIGVARRVAGIDRVIVSTDDVEIAAVARQHRVEVRMRPAALAGDDSLVADALRDLLAQLVTEGHAPRVLVLLEPTSPLRSVHDVERCLELLANDGIDSVATFKPAELNPWRAWRIEHGRPATFLPDVNPWLPRQRLPPAYQLNGAVYAFRADRWTAEDASILFGRAAAVVMPRERSVDIDGPLDLVVAEALLQGGPER